MEKAPWCVLLVAGLITMILVCYDEKKSTGKLSPINKSIIAGVIIIAVLLLLPGCYLLPKDQVGLAHGGITVMNNSRYDLLVFENGGANSKLIQPGEHTNISVMRQYENRSETIQVMAKAYEGGKYAGCAERGLTIYHHYSAQEMRYENNLPQSWIIDDYEIRR